MIQKGLRDRVRAGGNGRLGLPRRGPVESKLVSRATGPKARRVNLAGEVIVKDPDVLGGAPVFPGTRVPFQALLAYLEGGQNPDEFVDDFPTVTDGANQMRRQRGVRDAIVFIGVAQEKAQAFSGRKIGGQFE